ncbi:MAG TPA: hypothetical protein VJI68_02500 [Candidatus Nanoarchaeia archaeon]|nr:hypothetical protein [Candidatus Nanoarchaeia archaeon]
MGRTGLQILLDMQKEASQITRINPISIGAYYRGRHVVVSWNSGTFDYGFVVVPDSEFHSIVLAGNREEHPKLQMSTGDAQYPISNLRRDWNPTDDSHFLFELRGINNNDLVNVDQATRKNLSLVSREDVLELAKRIEDDGRAFYYLRGPTFRHSYPMESELNIDIQDKTPDSPNGVRTFESLPYQLPRPDKDKILYFGIGTNHRKREFGVSYVSNYSTMEKGSPVRKSSGGAFVKEILEENRIERMLMEIMDRNLGGITSLIEARRNGKKP